MEKVKFLNINGDILSGVISRSRNNGHRFITMIHGFTGNKDEKGLFSQADEYFIERGFSVFRFDIRGCGDSEGFFADAGLEEQTADLISAISFLKKKESLKDENIYLVGFSLGATISIMGYDHFPEVKALAFWSPAFFPNRDMYPRYQNEEIRIGLETKGYFIKSGLKVGKKLLDNLRDCNIVPLLQQIHTPTLIVHGEKDQRISLDSSKICLPLLNGYGHFKPIPHACHSFRSPEEVRKEVFFNTFNFFESFNNKGK